jgi:ATP-dependent DNA ligase
VLPFPRPKPKLWKDQDFWIVEEKLDGWRVSILRDGDFQACGRKEEIDLWPDIVKFGKVDCDLGLFVHTLRQIMPDDSIIDGELCVPGQDSSVVRTGLNMTNPNLVFRPFAVPWWDGQDKRAWNALEMRKLCEDLFCRLSRVPLPKLYLEETREALLKRASRDKIEGFVLKDGGYSDWYKLKPVRTIDAIITKVIPGKGEFTGGIGSLVISVWDGNELKVVGRVGTGFSVDDRYEWDEIDLIGEVVEVTYQEVTVHQKLRFPRFLRFREDKPGSECLMSQLS